MPLTSDLTLDPSKFDPKTIDPKTHELNEKLIKIMDGAPRFGAERYREMRWNGETPLPKPADLQKQPVRTKNDFTVVLPSGKNILLPSREPGRQIPCRVFHPDNGVKAKSLFYHIHGGGWVLQSEAYQDTMLQYLSTTSNLVVLSIGYRLAPEHPYPAGNEDCFDIGEYLVDHAERDYGVSMRFMSGDSAGAHLSVVTCYHLLKTKPKFEFKGLVLNFGAYDLSGFLPQVWNFKQPLVLDEEIMTKYIEAYLPSTTAAQRRDPMISPFFADFATMSGLPSALFVVGTADCLLEDSVFMSAKWRSSGADSVLRVYPGAPHGFVFFPPGAGGTPETQKALDDITMYINERV
ncbi:hypothetical protein LTR62_005252 [Meristemomyces frigidus]|uniref:Alpha/beta hydrolase fold-3 domain-containing protein n=1 Tax=Meristemomyces frigidus TaxID=1508187 RepID=A0AAN7TEW0_9PEZI|nr:hypothetical protein LTR62_005252 [Meristemomyces frigidus]